MVKILIISFSFLLFSIFSLGQLTTSKQLSGKSELIQAVLEHYPELDSTKIKVKAKWMCKRSMAARPNAFFLFQKDNSYVVVINKRKKFRNMYTNTGFSGILGHEFAHIVDYETQNDKELLKLGFKYVFNKEYRRAVENRTDSIAIAHGLGNKLVKGVETQFKHKKYWKRKRGIYYPPSKLKMLIKRKKAKL